MKTLILIAGVVVLTASVTASAAVINVPADQPTVQAGINAAADGDSVLIAPGTYYENVIIDHPLALLGMSTDDVMLDGSNSGDVVTVTSNNVSIASITVQNAGSYHELYENYDACIELANVDSATVFKSRLLNGGAGVAMWASCRNEVSCCEISAVFAGVYLHEDPYGNWVPQEENVIGRNRISGCSGYGILLEHTVANYHEHCTFMCNDISDCGTGYYAIMSSENEVCYNTFEDNSLGVRQVACMAGGQDNLYHHNRFLGCTAVDVSESPDDWNAANPCEGNYWYDYAGSDVDGDGIGDSPYPISGIDNDHDFCPLMDMVSFVPGCWGIRGNVDADWDEMITIADLVSLVDYMFSGGVLLCSSQEADINGNGTEPDIDDLVYLVSYMFTGGPAPAVCP